MTFYENTDSPERVLLISVDTGDFNAEESIEELALLVETAGGEAVVTSTQKLPSVNPATYVGSGRIQEIAEICRTNEIDLIVADDELSPAQLKNIEDLTDTRVIDRTMLILDIFALRARSSEGKLQVELAQLKYSLPFLTGKGKSLSRLGGGIGTRGPGESKLESDKRHMRRKIYALEEELKQIEKRRNTMRSRRKKDGIISVAIVGYTNAGKSTLMNRLTDAGVLAEDKLFATLDPVVRQITLPDGMDILLSDTVGFINKLPHDLIEAFKSTLEEAANADIILHVVDISSDHYQAEMRVVEDVIASLGAADIPRINVYNKIDLIDVRPKGTADDAFVSAATGEGMQALLNRIEHMLSAAHNRIEIAVPYDKYEAVAILHNEAKIISEEHSEQGALITAMVEENTMRKLKKLLGESIRTNEE